MIAVELMFGSLGVSVIRDMPAVPRVGEHVTVYKCKDEDLPIVYDGRTLRVKDVMWTCTSEILQKRTICAVMLEGL